MDEPFGATDPITREKLQAEFLRLQSEIGKAIIVVTHDFDEATGQVRERCPAHCEI